MKKKCSFFGYLSTFEPSVNGQTLRTRNLRRLLEEELGYVVDSYDTQEFPVRPFSIFRKLVAIRKCDLVFMSFAHRGILFLLPLIFLTSFIFKKKIYYVAIGGWLPEFLKGYRYLRYFISRLDYLFVQSDILSVEINEILPRARVKVLPNFKFYNFHKEDVANSKDERKRLRLVYLSKICEEKGIDTMEYIAMNLKELDANIDIDLYGPIDSEFKPHLNRILSNNTLLKYNGILDQANVFETLSKYDSMIFPTHYRTEGFPGVILDSFIAGIPVIAADWKFSSEFIKPEFGFIFPHNSPEVALNYIMKIYEDSDLLNRMKAASYRQREVFSVSAMTQLMTEWGF